MKKNVLVLLLVFAISFSFFGNLSLKNESAKVQNTFAFEQVPQIGTQSLEDVIIIKMIIGNTTIYVNGEPQSIDVAPTIVESRTLLPIRWVAEPLGATVNWESTSKKVTVSLNSTTIELWIGNNTANVNGSSKQIDPGNPKVVPLIISGRTMLPVRFISENLGCQVDWESTSRTVTITYEQPLSNTTSSAVVTPENGGTVALADGASVTIPRNSVAGNTTLSITKTPYESSGLPITLTTAGYGVYNITAGDASITGQVQITLPIKNTGSAAPEIFYWNGYFWESLGGTVAGNMVTCETTHFSWYTVLIPERLTDEKVHTFASSKIKGAFIGTGLLLRNSDTNGDDLPSILAELQKRHYNKIYLNCGGIDVQKDASGKAVGIKANWITGNDQLNKNVELLRSLRPAISVELVFGVPNAVFAFLQNHTDISGDFDQKVAKYSKLLNEYKYIEQWISGTAVTFGSPGLSSQAYDKIHLNLESWPDPTVAPNVSATDAEAATVAAIGIFRQAGCSVSVSILDGWTAQYIAKMNGADYFAVQAYNLGIKSADKVRLIVDNARKKIKAAGFSADKLIITMPYYNPTTENHPATENMTMYAKALHEYSYLEELGGAYVYDFANYDPLHPMGDGSYENSGDLDAFDGLYLYEPDLVVDSLSWSPTSPKEGDNVTFTANIKNIGQADATNFNTKLYVGGNAVDTKNTSTLAAGSSTAIMFTNKWTATSGCQDVKVVVDSDNAVQESSETNNELTKQICPEIQWTINDSRNDLLGTGTITGKGSYSLSKIGYHGDYIGTDCLSAYVQNDNSVTFMIKAYLLGNMDTFKWYTRSAHWEGDNPVGQGQDSSYSKYTTFTRSGTSIINDGYDYNLDEAVDIVSASIYYRSDLDSYVFNIKMRSLQILAGRFSWEFIIWDSTHSYLIGLFYQPQWYNNVSYNMREKWTVQIQTLRDPYPYGNDAYYDILSSSVAIENSDTLRLTMKLAGQIPLNQLDIMPVYSWKFDIDNDSKTGNYIDGTEVSVAAEFNNGWTGTMMKFGQDAKVKGLSCTVSGDTIVVRVPLSQVGLSLIKPFRWLSESSVQILNKDMQRDFSILGCYDWGYIGFKDMGPDIGTVSTENKPDVLVENLTWNPTSPKEGDAITFTAGVRNQGWKPITDSFNVSLYIGNSLFDTKTVNSLAANSSAVVTFRTWTGIAGDNYIKIVVDSGNSINESNEDNNTYTNLLTIQGQSSVKVLSPNGGEKLKVGSTFTINWQANGVYTGHFDIFYSIDNGQNWILIAYTLPEEGFSYNWVVPNNVSDKCLIFIGHSFGGKWLSSDRSDANFSITP